MQACVLVTAAVPDPKGAKAALAPFYNALDGIVVLHAGQPLVLTTAAAVLPLLPPQRRHAGSLAGTTHAGLTPGAHLTATLSSSASQGEASTVELRLLCMAPMPAVRQALLRLLHAPSVAGRAGWQLGWLMQEPAGAAPMQQQHGQQQQGQHSTEAAPTPASGIDMLAAASHLALLQPTSGEGAAALRRLAMPWPGAFAPVQQGQLVTAVGAPFGALAPQHFAGFLAGGVVSAAVPASSSAAGGGSSSAAGPALLLADLRCSPGMEGGPVYAAAPTAVAAPLQAASSQQQQPQQPQLTGMLLPPLKAPQAGLEFALVAPAAAVLAAVDALLSRTSSSSPAADGPTSTAEAAAWAPAALAAALPSVVAVTAGGSWASGVVVSSAGHILTNAHLLQPPTPLLSPADSRRGPGQLSVHPAAPPPPDAHPPVQVLLPAAGGTSTPGAGSSWQTADVLYVFQGPLDLAVLQLRPAAAQQALRWRAARLARQQPQAGQPLYVAGYPAFSPRASPLAGPLVTAGDLAKVVRLPGGEPAMLLTTAAVHSGASGGAVVDAATGQLLGICTSNAKHSRSGGGGGTGSRLGSGRGGGAVTVLPHLNFSIPAAQLAPVVRAAQEAAAAEEAGGALGDAAGAALAAWRALDAEAAGSSELLHVWRLDPRQRERRRQQEQQQGPGGGGGFGGAVPPAKLQQLLRELRQPQAKL